MNEHATVPANEAEARARDSETPGVRNAAITIQRFNSPPLIRQGRRDMARRFGEARAWRRRWGIIAWLVGALVFGLIVSSLLCGAAKLE